MARNKHPEETVVKILDVAMRLFVERGYEQTSMQNIIDGLGGLTKGAVYHHFSSKEEIFFAAMDRVTAPGVERLRKIRDAKGMTGREKIQAMFQNGVRGVDSAFFPARDEEEQMRRVAFMNDFLSAMGLEVALDPQVSLETWRHRCGGPVQESVQASARADATRDARAGERTQG